MPSSLMLATGNTMLVSLYLIFGASLRKLIASLTCSETSCHISFSFIKHVSSILFHETLWHGVPAHARGKCRLFTLPRGGLRRPPGSGGNDSRVPHPELFHFPQGRVGI